MSHRSRAPNVVFAGGGHAHLYSLLRTWEPVRRGLRVTLADPSPYLYYSGMATGVISGFYEPGENRLDVRRLLDAAAADVEGRAESREIGPESGDAVPYAAASLCLGSASRAAGAPTGDATVPMKPISSPVGRRACPGCSSSAGTRPGVRSRTTHRRCSAAWAPAVG